MESGYLFDDNRIKPRVIPSYKVRVDSRLLIVRRSYMVTFLDYVCSYSDAVVVLGPCDFETTDYKFTVICL